jgi:ribonuclease Z
MTFSVKILGSGAAIPTTDRNPTAHLVEIGNQLLLLDCGEGTQMQLRKSGAKIQKIRHIFISHLHGDHYFGLIGLINTLHLYGRTQDLHLYGIQPLKDLIDLQLSLSRTTLQYPLIFHAIDPDVPLVILDEKQFTVTTIPLNHRVPTCGFLITEKPERRKIRKDFLKTARVPVEYFDKIKDGEDYTDESGQIHLNHLITDDPPAVKSYAYCTDTAYHEPIIPLIRNCDLLYHEATFMEDKAADARAKFHSTAREAASIAQQAGVKKLLIGHFSARYNDADGLLREAKEVFAETVLAQDGMKILI